MNSIATTKRADDEGRRSSQQPIDALALPDALLRIGTVSTVTGLSASSIFRKTAKGDFPARIRMGTRCTRWRAGDVRAWLECMAAGKSYSAKESRPHDDAPLVRRRRNLDSD